MSAFIVYEHVHSAAVEHGVWRFSGVVIGLQMRGAS